MIDLSWDALAPGADVKPTTPVAGVAYFKSEEFAARLRRRYAAERLFQALGAGAIWLAVLALVLLLASIISRGYSAFVETRVELEIHFDARVIDPDGSRDSATLAAADYLRLARQGLQALFPGVTERAERRALNELLSSSAATQLRRMVIDDPALIGSRRKVSVLASSEIDQVIKGNLIAEAGTGQGRISDRQLAWVHALQDRGLLRQNFNLTLFTTGDSRDPEQAGILGAVAGSVLILLITLALAVPVGVAAAIYLEELAPKNRWTTLIEVNINNLAAVPSIVFGLLGLAVFLNAFGLPRSTALAGGLVLALMTLPTIIIAARSAFKAVPPSIREAALGVGASRTQAIFHHVLPLAMPGILTGVIIGMSRALGETAPLLMIGMVAFVVDVPTGVTDSATALPVQIYMWAASAERAFVERTSAAILVLLSVLIAMNAIAVFLRRKYEIRW